MKKIDNRISLFSLCLLFLSISHTSFAQRAQKQVELHYDFKNRAWVNTDKKVKAFYGANSTFHIVVDNINLLKYQVEGSVDQISFSAKQNAAVGTLLPDLAKTPDVSTDIAKADASKDASTKNIDKKVEEKKNDNNRAATARKQDKNTQAYVENQNRQVDQDAAKQKEVINQKNKIVKDFLEGIQHLDETSDKITTDASTMKSKYNRLLVIASKDYPDSTTAADLKIKGQDVTNLKANIQEGKKEIRELRRYLNEEDNKSILIEILKKSAVDDYVSYIDSQSKSLNAMNADSTFLIINTLVENITDPTNNSYPLDQITTESDMLTPSIKFKERTNSSASFGQ